MTAHEPSELLGAISASLNDARLVAQAHRMHRAHELREWEIAAIEAVIRALIVMFPTRGRRNILCVVLDLELDAAFKIQARLLRREQRAKGGAR
jgi:hypothetical protein